jgi:hypothetical protein
MVILVMIFGDDIADDIGVFIDVGDDIDIYVW